MNGPRSAIVKWQRFWRLASPERRALLGGLALLPLMSLALRFLSFRRLQRMLSKLVPHGIPGLVARSEPAMQEAKLTARMVASASREGLVHGNCLERSLTLWWLLRRRRIPAQLRIGVRKHANQFQAHAWVELEGAVLNDSDGLHQEYAAFERDIGAVEVDVQ